MGRESILVHERDVFSQNGEDGIIGHIFGLIGAGSQLCGEIGAWDGEHLSNTRALILDGWGGLLVEADEDRCQQLAALYEDRRDVVCVQARAGVDVSMADLLAKSPRLDFLSIDVDGLDYELMRDLPQERLPRLLRVEVNAGHHPTVVGLLPSAIAARNIGQPFAEFDRLAGDLGYRLVGYTGNAFFLHQTELQDPPVTLNPSQAYADFLEHLPTAGREWLYLVNTGTVEPHWRFANSLLSRQALKISARRGLALRARPQLRRLTTLTAAKLRQ